MDIQYYAKTGEVKLEKNDAIFWIHELFELES